MPRRILLTLLLLLPLPAFAHAILLRSTPAPHGHTSRTPTFTLRFNSRVDGPRSKLTLTANTTDVPLSPTTQPSPAMLTAAPQAPLKPGPYTLHFIVLASDGHISRGELPFTVD